MNGHSRPFRVLPATKTTKFHSFRVHQGEREVFSSQPKAARKTSEVVSRQSREQPHKVLIASGSWKGCGRRAWNGLFPVRQQDLWRGLLLPSENNPPGPSARTKNATALPGTTPAARTKIAGPTMLPRYACRALNSHTKEAKWRISQIIAPWYETLGAYSHTEERLYALVGRGAGEGLGAGYLQRGGELCRGLASPR